MANHHILNHNGCDITATDSWQALTVDNLPDGIAPTDLTLSEVLHKQEKHDLILPLSDLLNADGKLAGGLLHELCALIDSHTSRTGVWLSTDTDADRLAGIIDFLSTQAIIVLFVPAFADGRNFSIAQSLRKLGYSGEIRVAGKFGRDQIAYLLRVGIDSFVISEHDMAPNSDFDIVTAFHALPSSYDGQDAGALPMFAGA